MVEAPPVQNLAPHTPTDWLIMQISREGYTAIGIIGFAPGSNNGIVFNQVYLQGNQIQYALINNSDTTQSTNPRFYILWKKNSV